MSGVGSSELIILILIGLIVLGPRRLPQIANQLGSWIGQARRMTRAMRRQLEDELNLDDDFNIKPPKISPPFAAEAADPDGDSHAPEADIPSDDDTNSPLHDDDGEAADEVEQPEADIPSDDDTYSPLHDDDGEAANEVEQQEEKKV